jgi:hypothetical protein
MNRTLRLLGLSLLLAGIFEVTRPTPAYAAVCRSGAGDVCLCEVACSATATSCTCNRE